MDFKSSYDGTRERLDGTGNRDLFGESPPNNRKSLRRLPSLIFLFKERGIQMKKGRFLVVLITLVMVFTSVSIAEDAEVSEPVEMIVIASQLNGRAYPTKKSSKEAFFDYGDVVNATGKWSEDHKWIEIMAGEGGTVWCKAEYLTERTDSFIASNEGRKAVRIRKSPVDGRVTGYLKAGKTTKITQVILGWGKCSKGWIDLGYLCEVVGANEN